MQITGEIDWKEQDEAGGGKALDQREEITAVRSLTSKVAAERRSADFYQERDLYLDMDLALPFHWESLTGKGHKLSKSSDSQEFEFSMSGLSVDPSDPIVPDGISPADELFYKGKLLPLHLPKRMQMVQKLSSPKHSDKGNPSPCVTVSCFFQPSSLKYTSLGNDEGHLGSALVNSRSSSFHSQGSNNFWETDSPGELDSGDSSSSRDSSGSSQDACVPEQQALPKFKDHIAFDKESRFFQHRDFISSHNLRSEKSFSSWLRSPFKWKVLFGSKKPSSKARGDYTTDVEDHSRSEHKLPFASGKGPRQPGTSNVRSSRPHHDFSAEQSIGAGLRRESASDLEYQGGLFSFPGADMGRDRDRDREQDSSAKGRESLHKYLNILKPGSAKAPLRESQAADSSVRMVDIKPKTSFSGNLSASSPKHSFSPSIPSPKAALTKNLSSPKSSFPEQRCRSPTMHSLSGNLRVPSFSRSSKASMNASNAVRKTASPNNSGLLNHSPSSMAELHSAIQGAIAHCKQSQSVDR